MNPIRDRVRGCLLRGHPPETVVGALVRSYSTLGITNTVAEAIVREEACAQENEPADDSGAVQETPDAGEVPAEQEEIPSNPCESPADQYLPAARSVDPGAHWLRVRSLGPKTDRLIDVLISGQNATVSSRCDDVVDFGDDRPWAPDQ